MILPYLKLMRLHNCLMTAIAIFVGGFIVIGMSPGYFFSMAPLYIAMVVGFLITGAGNAINDIFDIESDKINRPKRPIPSKQISRKKAGAFTVALFAVGILLSGFLNWICFGLAIFNSALLIAYSAVLQNKVLLGNISVSYLTGSAFLFGGAAAMNLKLPLILMLLASLATLSREIIKDLEDVEGDRVGFLKRIVLNVKSGIANRFGLGDDGNVSVTYRRQTVVNTAIASLTCAILISPVPFLLNTLGWFYLLMVIPTDIIFVVCIYFIAKTRNKKNYSRISKLIKVAMFWGMIAFMVGVVL